MGWVSFLNPTSL